ncbi:hypothetical protein Rsub_11877 [Raphidocelis subcapitata]|uniref:Uncharacterized protein n=1 Tax=Raphidocelis subcapitata TaxID=307507 RepID=A0A2V0PMF8_9CHLO|nr:hypothetical protein Rsub_11877 [Raphidocelis subcapitata]|eukprot:GBF98547.1 hypothetical protein Rsub_11877 [Raphidocelis subcapitata]
MNRRALALFLSSLLMASPQGAAGAGARRMLGGGLMPVAFEVTPLFDVPAPTGWANVRLLNDAAGYEQAAGDRPPNESNSATAGRLERATFEPAGAGPAGAGPPAPVLLFGLRNNGALQPMDVGSPLVGVTLKLRPLGVNGLESAPDSEPFDVSFRVMWTAGGGAPPNKAGLFSLVHPLPSVEFKAYGAPHKFELTGLRVGGGAGGAQPRKAWWNKEADDPAAGVAAALVPEDGRAHEVELLARVTLL